MTDIVLIAHNLRSAHNVGSLLRTAEGLGVSKIWLTGYSPYPHCEIDTRLPHLAKKIDAQISKTSLGAETTIDWSQSEKLEPVLAELKQQGFVIVGLEQSDQSIKLNEFEPPEKLAIIVGREVEGIEQEVLRECNEIVEIPMFGKKESFNVVQAAAMALYHCRFYT